MAPSLKIVVVFLVFLQLAQQASITKKYYDTQDLGSPLNNDFAFHSRFNVLSSIKTQQSPRHKHQVKNEEVQRHLNVDRDGLSSFRFKRQLDQDAETDSEIISNDPKMFSYGKSMPMTTSDDDIDELQHGKLGSDSWNEDGNTSHKNSLGGLEDKPEDEDEEQGAKSDIEESKQMFHDVEVAAQDVSATETTLDNSTDIRGVPAMTYKHPASIDFKESDSQSDNIKSSELQDSAHSEDDDHDKGDKLIVDREHSTQLTQELGVAEETVTNGHKKIGSFENMEEGKGTVITESETIQNEMKKEAADAVHEEAHSSGAPKLNDANVEHSDNESEQIILKELDIDDNEDELIEHFDHEDAEVFLHLPVDDSGSKSTLGQLKLLEEDSAEGSGDMESDLTGSRETQHMHNNVATKNTDDNHTAQVSPTIDSLNFDIDSDTDNIKEDSDDIDEDEEESEAPISAPTEIGSNVNDPAQSLTPSEDNEDRENDEEIPDHTEKSSKVDESVTYDPKWSINPFNIDNASEITKHIGKAIGIYDSSEETNKGEESEGSGNSFLFPDTELEKNSLENGAMFKIDPRMLPEDAQPDFITSGNGPSNVNEVTEEPVLVRHHDVLLNAAPTPEVEAEGESTSHGSVDSSSEEVSEATPTLNAQVPPDDGQRIFDTVSVSGNGSALFVPASINELGVQKSEETALPESEEKPSSSSTGSFIVLGAIMATIVVLLGYSVIKSRKQKQDVSRRQLEDDVGTELKEIDTLLNARNGHGPGNRLNESDRLLTPGGGIDKPDGRSPIYQNGVNGENNKVNQPPNGLQIEEPNGLSEVKLMKPLNSIAPDLNPVASNPQVANGLDAKNSPRNINHSNQIGEPKSSPRNNMGSRNNYITKPETAKIKMFIDHDSIPKTPIVIVKRGPANV